MVYLHVVCGSLLLILGMYVLVRNIKKVQDHLTVGYLYLLCAIIVCASSAILAVDSGHTFLVPLSMLIVYQVTCGLLTIWYKNDYFKFAGNLAIPMIPVAFSLLLYGESALVVMSAVYMLILGYQVVLSINLGVLCKMEYLSQHISMMLGSLVAMVTALVLRVNSDDPLNVWYWLIPTIVAVWAIRWYKIKYAPINTKRKLKWY